MEPNPPKITGGALLTPMNRWELLRAPADEDAAAMVTDFSSGYSFSDLSSQLVDLRSKFKNAFGAVMIKFYALKNDPETYTPVANDTFAFQLFGFRSSPAGPGELLCEASSNTSCLLGTMAVAQDPVTGAAVTAGGLWADTLAITNYWIRTCTVYESGNNRAATLFIPDLLGIRFLRLKIYQTDGITANEANNIGAIITAV